MQRFICISLLTFLLLTPAYAQESDPASLDAYVENLRETLSTHKRDLEVKKAEALQRLEEAQRQGPPGEAPAQTIDSPPRDEPAAEAMTLEELRQFTREPFLALERERAELAPNHWQPDEIAAAQGFKETATAPVIERTTTIHHPYGLSQPTIRCVPKYSCDIAFEPGETVLELSVGDRDGWNVMSLKSAGFDGPVTHAIITPADLGLATNLVVGTDRRTYHIMLTSPTAKELKADPSFIRHLSFYYPKKMVETWSLLEEAEEQKQQAAAAEANHVSAVVAERLARPIESVNFRYSVRAKPRHKRVSWAPVAVFDDGHRVFIQLPKGAPQPAMLINRGGEDILPNYHVASGKIVIHSLFDTAILFEGTGRKRRSIVIERTEP